MMDNSSRGFLHQGSPSAMMQPNLRSSKGPRSVAQDEQEGVAKRKFPKKGKKSRKKLAQFLKF